MKYVCLDGPYEGKEGDVLYIGKKLMFPAGEGIEETIYYTESIDRETGTSRMRWSGRIDGWV